MEQYYKTAAEPGEARFTIKKSEFIGYICPVCREEEAIAFINKVKEQNRKAAHNCYAYILRENNITRYSDDGEPAGTAGIPIFEVIRKEGLVDVAVVVTRYFGGILLGAGGLVRAYGNGASSVIKAVRIKNIFTADKIRLKLDYSLYGRLSAVFLSYNVRIAEENFSEIVTIELFVRENISKKFSEEIINLCNGKIVVEMLQKEPFDFG